MRPAVVDSALEGDSDRERFAQAARAGFEGIEVSLARAELRAPVWERLASLRQARAETGVEIAALSLPGHNQGGIGAADPRISGAAAADLRQAIFWAVELHTVVIRVPFYDEGELTTDFAMQRAAKAFRELCPLAHDHGLLLVCDAPLSTERLWQLAAGVNPRLFSKDPRAEPSAPSRGSFSGGLSFDISDRLRMDWNDWPDDRLDAERMRSRLLGWMREEKRALQVLVVRAIAEDKKWEHQIAEAQIRITQWQQRAEQAVLRDEDDLAREAIRRRNEYIARLDDCTRQREGQKIEMDRLKQELDEIERRYRRAELLWMRYLHFKGGALKSLLCSELAFGSPDEPISEEWLDNLFHLQDMLEAGTLQAAHNSSLRPVEAGFGCCVDLDDVVSRGLNLSMELQLLGDLIQQVRLSDSCPNPANGRAGSIRMKFPGAAVELAKIGYDGWIVFTSPPDPPAPIPPGIS